MEPLARRRVRNRVYAVMLHIPKYTIEGQSRLAIDAGVPHSTSALPCAPLEYLLGSSKMNTFMHI